MIEEVVRAAGGVVWREGAEGIEVLFVHRPKYDDWSLPKGKLEPGEADEDAALREVEEETGLRCRIGREVGQVRYRDRHDRQKRVRYWAMTPIDGRFSSHEEVDEVRWLPIEDVGSLASYEHDVELVRRFAP